MTSTLAHHLRAMSDEDLGVLLRARPDLVVPIPADMSTLAGRMQGRVSVARALDRLDMFGLEILDGLRLIRDTNGKRTSSLPALLSLAVEAGADAGQVRAAVASLRERLLIHGPDDELHLPAMIDDLLSPYPAGLGRAAADLDPAAAALAADPALLRRTLLTASPEARAILDRLASGPPLGQVPPGALHDGRPGSRQGRRAGAAPAHGQDTHGQDTHGQATSGHDTSGQAEPESPIRWLLRHNLLVTVGDDLVELPREVGIVLRRDAGPLGTLHPEPPEITGAPRSGHDSAGAGQALEAIRHVDAVLQALEDNPATVLRSFGLGVRDLRRLSRDCGLSEADTALFVEIAYAAGLLTYTDPTGNANDQRWLPSPSYDSWRTADLAHRWALLGRTWLTTTRAPALVGQRGDKDKTINALSYEAARLAGPAVRRAVLDVLAELPEAVPGDEEAVLARLVWRSPRRIGHPHSPASPYALAQAALTEAASLGITGLGALTSYGRVLLAEAARDPDADPLGIRIVSDESADPLVATLGALLPAPVDHILVQADLTVVVPGPPLPALAAELSMLAEAESRGGATVYRVTAQSVRQALDCGYLAADIHALFAKRSRTPVPQTLTYLVDDVARRHGGLRVGNAGAYLRGDDEALISQVLADRKLAALSLRRLAPTVLVTAIPAARLLDALRDGGYAPVPEDAAGVAVLSRPKAARAPARPLPRANRADDFDPPRLSDPRLAGVIEQIRRGDRLARAARRSPTASGRDGGTATGNQAHLEALAVLTQALRDQCQVWVGYVDAHGTNASRLVRPVSISAGFLRAEDERSQMLHTFALHRITSAVLDE